MTAPKETARPGGNYHKLPSGEVAHEAADERSREQAEQQTRPAPQSQGYGPGNAGPASGSGSGTYGGLDIEADRTPERPTRPR